MADTPGGLPWWMCNPSGGQTYLGRHGHLPDEPCPAACPGNPAPPVGSGGAGATALYPVFPSLRSCCQTAPGTGHLQGCPEGGKGYEWKSGPDPERTITVPPDSPGAEENAAAALGLPANWPLILAEKDAEIARLTAELDDARGTPVEYVPAGALEAAMAADPGRLDGTVLREMGGPNRAVVWRAETKTWEQVA